MPTRVTSFLSSWLVVGAALTATAGAQSPIRLKAATGTLKAEFTGVTSMRELSDERVIVTDGRDQTLWVTDFVTGRKEPLGRKGRGPGEYLMIGWIRSIGGDSSIMLDLQQRRWLLFDGARITGSVPPDHPAIIRSQSTFSFADSLGHVMHVRPAPVKAGVNDVTARDSSAVELVARSTGRADTVAMLRPRPHRYTVEYGSDGRIRSSRNELTDRWARAEQGILLVDGSLAVVRLDPLRVDWRSPNGTWLHGAALPVKPLALDRREKEAINSRRAQAAAEARVMPSGVPQPSLAPLTDFPATLPLISADMLSLATAQGQLLIRRTQSIALPGTRYLVVNRRGTLDGELVLEEHSEIIGFGAKSVYVITADEDGIQRLSRHPWP